MNEGMNDKGPTKAEYEELVEDFTPNDVIGNFRVTRFNGALIVKVCTTRLRRNFEFGYMVHDIETTRIDHSGDSIIEDWMNWSDNTDGCAQKMTLEQMEKCIAHKEKWLTGHIFAGEC